MGIKTKIIKILPYWLIVLFLLCVSISGPALLNLKPFTNEALSQVPQVLGESTIANDLIRGQATAPKQISQIKVPDTSNIKAQSFLVFDLATKQALLQKNPSQKLAIASLTKLMTALVAYNNSNLNLSFTVSSKDNLNVSPFLGLVPGDQVAALDVFNSMLIGSCNDAALALANFTEQQSGKDFVDLMNTQAQSLGMADSNFSNPLGFDSGSNYSTALDLQLLIEATQKLSSFTDLGRRTTYEFFGSLGKKYLAVATNTLIKNHSDIQAVKTGYTAEANGAMATKIGFGQDQIIILVLDSSDREGDTLRLKNTLAQDFIWN